MIRLARFIFPSTFADKYSYSAHTYLLRNYNFILKVKIIKSAGDGKSNKQCLKNYDCYQIIEFYFV